MWTVAQIGAREHYFPARSLAASGRLDRLYTDIWCRWGHSWLRRGPTAVRALAGRYCPDIPSRNVVAFNCATLFDRLIRQDRRPHQFYDECLRIGRRFDAHVCRHLQRQQLHRGEDAFFGYNTGVLSTLRMLRDRGIYSVVDQIDPARTEYEIALREREKWPGWELQSYRIPDAYFEHMSAEWDAAAAVLVNSEWSAQALVAQGVSGGKIMVVPLYFDPSGIDAVPRQIHAGPLVVLWLGLVVLRKGIQYLMEAARRLQDRNIRFEVVGNVLISETAVASAPPNLRFLGRYSREQTAAAYRAADVFVLPTLSDGFAITQLEAMAHGLPVIATPNCGKVVEPEVDGLIVPAGDAEALAAAIARLDDDRRLIAAMSQKAIEKSRRFHLTDWADRLDTEWRRWLNRPG